MNLLASLTLCVLIVVAFGTWRHLAFRRRLVEDMTPWGHVEASLEEPLGWVPA